jgi:hypothetical protein
VQKFNPEIIVHVAVFSRGKPQKHSYGAVCTDGHGKPLISAAKFVGTVNKSAALERGLAWCLEQTQRLQAEKIEIRVDDQSAANSERVNALLQGFRFHRFVRLDSNCDARVLAEKAHDGWREILKK